MNCIAVTMAQSNQKQCQKGPFFVVFLPSKHKKKLDFNINTRIGKVVQVAKTFKYFILKDN